MPEGHETRWWWDEPSPLSKLDLSWGNILSKWDHIETDFHRLYGTDFGDGILTRRTYRWFRTRLYRLFREDSSLSHALGLHTINTPER